ncbi:MAG: EamA family transporter, partial [Clostridia bacterium]|nr:EamA family transporter [Clostridia bacterium]
MILSAMLIWGTIGLFRRYIPLSSAFLAFSRGILGGAFLLVLMHFRRGKAAERLPVRTIIRLSVTGAAIGFNWILLFEAYNYTTVAVATLCYYMQPTIVILLSPLIFSERLTARRAVCAFVAIVGMIFVSGVIGGNAAQATNLKGIFLGLGAAVLYSVVVIMNKRTAGIDAYQKTTVQLLSAGSVLIPYLLLTSGFSDIVFSMSTAILVLVLGIVHTGIAYVLYFRSIDGLKAQSIAILSYFDPVAAMLVSAVFLSEAMDIYHIIGAVMIIGSAVIS